MSTASHLYLGCGGYVYALNKADGSQIWKSPIRGSGILHPMLLPIPSRNVILACAGVNIRCFNAINGAEIWENKLSGMGLGNASLVAPAASEVAGLHELRVPEKKVKSAKNLDPKDVVFVGAGAHIRAIEASTGRDLWEYHPRGFKKGMHGSILVEDEKVFVGQGGRVTALNFFTGEEIWSLVPGGWHSCIFATMASGNGQLNRTNPSQVLLQKLEDDANRNASS
ncbi:hypothetical protein HDU67_000237 [Dinochytrium kinnereticum]|nr:hypothetical protein HDU67_000237 [Dinochytrium kinnereticum]